MKILFKHRKKMILCRVILFTMALLYLPVFHEYKVQASEKTDWNTIQQSELADDNDIEKQLNEPMDNNQIKSQFSDGNNLNDDAAQTNDIADLNKKYDYSEIQDVIDNVLGEKNQFNFGDYTNRLISGQEPFSIKGVFGQLLKSIQVEIKANIGTFITLITIAIIAALFTNLSMAFKNNQVSETGYYITYLLLFGVLISSFVVASGIASATISTILDFMRALVPTYLMSVAFCTGPTTSLVYYQAALGLITLVDFVLIKVVIPMIDFYLIIMLVNNMSKEDTLSRLASIFSTAVNWLLKSMLAAVVGFNVIQGLIVPVADQVKRSVILKASSALPGIGGAIGGVTETVLGAGVLLKNAIGVAGLIVIITICAVPLIKLLIISVVYKIGSATLQPISDKRFIECISATAKSAGMLLQTVFVGAILFVLSITIVAVTTSAR